MFIFSIAFYIDYFPLPHVWIQNMREINHRRSKRSDPPLKKAFLAAHNRNNKFNDIA